MIPGELGIDIFSEMERIIEEPYNLCIVDKTEKELENLVFKYGRKKEGLNAKLAYILLKQKSLKKIKSSNNEYVDDTIVNYAKKNSNIIVATQDKELKKRLKTQNIRLIVLKQKKYLSFEVN